MKFSQKAFRAAAAALSALLLAGCTGMLWLSYVQNGKISFEDGRTFRIGNDIDRNRIDAKLENGILTLVLHKSEAVKPKKIMINQIN